GPADRPPRVDGGRLPRSRRHVDGALRDMHAHGLSGRVERRRRHVGLPVPRLALQPRRRGHFRTGREPAGRARVIIAGPATRFAHYDRHVSSSPKAAANITAVVAHPTRFANRPLTCSPSTFLLFAISM